MTLRVDLPPFKDRTVIDRDDVAGRAAPILVFDSGLGGLTVLGEIVKALPGCDLSFGIDDAGFPYGGLDEALLVSRVIDVLGEMVSRERPSVVVIACNTASTVVLPPLRARWPEITFVGTVPAIKPAAALSTSRLVSVLATPGTVAREYTRDLVRSFAADCTVTLVGSTSLAGMAEAAMRGEAVRDGAIAAEIAPAFVEQASGRTDAIVLACTHYPLLLDRLEAVAPWPVVWIDPAPAIARRVVQVLRERGALGLERGGAVLPPRLIPAVFTSGRPPGEALRAFLEARGLACPPGPFL